MTSLRDFHTRNLLLDRSDPEALRDKMLAYFETTFSLFERLFDSFASDDTFYVQPEPLRHPHIFYFGHTATFYINKLTAAGLIGERINPRFESMFSIGVDEMSWDDLSSERYDWPAVSEVRAYRNRVREVVREVIRTLDLRLPVGWMDPAWAVMMGIEHERIHLETSSVLIRQTALKHLKPAPMWTRCMDSGPAPANELLPVPGGRVHLGKSRDPNQKGADEGWQYGWDNEYGTHEAEIAPFKAARHLVSNGEFMAFVEAGGYRETR